MDGCVKSISPCGTVHRLELPIPPAGASAHVNELHDRTGLMQSLRLPSHYGVSETSLRVPGDAFGLTGLQIQAIMHFPDQTILADS
jgi:hypothetical protein